MQARIRNASTSQTVQIHLTDTIHAEEPSGSGEPLGPGEMYSRVATAGTANLFVYDSEGSKVWQGVVPMSASPASTVDIYPEEKRVTHGGMDLPSDFGPVTEAYSRNKSGWKSLAYIIGIILLIIGMIYACYCLLRRR